MGTSAIVRGSAPFVACLVAYGLGFWTRDALLAPRDADGRGSEAAPHAPPRGPVASEVARADFGELASCRREVHALEQTIDAAEAVCRLRIATSGGYEPLAWPASAPTGIDPASVHALVAAAVEDCPWLDAGVLEIDCDEYPCAVFIAAKAADLGSCGGLLTPADGVATVSSSRTAGGAMVGLFYSPTADDVHDPAAVDARRSIRFRQALETYTAPSDPR